MERKLCDTRPDWEKRIIRDGITFSRMELPDGRVHHYWREGVFYEFGLPEIETIERQAQELFNMCDMAGDWIAALPDRERAKFLWEKMRIPKFAHKAVMDSWIREPADQSVYARFDLRYMGPSQPVQLYEFNAQTPTSLMEAAYVQWRWLQESGAGSDQWNMIWDRLIEAWRRNLALWGPRMGFDPDAHPNQKPTVHFAFSYSENEGEDELTVSYLADACMEAGYKVRKIQVEHIKLVDGRFYVPKEGKVLIKEHTSPNDDHEEYAWEDLEPINICFVLYPYEWIWNERFGKAMFKNMEMGPKLDSEGNYVGGTVWFEAPYKMLWSNKALLPLLWKLFGDDPVRSQYLIPAWWKGEEPSDLGDYVEKPIFGREGGSMRVIRDGKLAYQTDGPYASEDPKDYVVQAYAPPAVFVDEASQSTVSTILGVWVIDGDVSGMSVREDTHEITSLMGHFVPHTITSTIQDSLPQPGSIQDTVDDHPKDEPPSSPEVSISIPSAPAYARFNAPQR